MYAGVNSGPPLSLSDVGRFLVSALLAVAAGLKLRGGSTPIVEFSMFNAAIVVFEVGLSIWLVVGAWWKSACYAAILTFAWLAGISVAKALTGKSSCGCFGEVEVSPWITLGLDLLVIAVLAYIRHERPCGSLLVRMIAAALVLLGFSGVAAKGVGLTPSREANLRRVLPAELRQGQWEVTVVRSTCRACFAHLNEGQLKKCEDDNNEQLVTKWSACPAACPLDQTPQETVAGGMNIGTIGFGCYYCTGSR